MKQSRCESLLLQLFHFEEGMRNRISQPTTTTEETIKHKNNKEMLSIQILIHWNRDQPIPLRTRSWPTSHYLVGHTYERITSCFDSKGTTSLDSVIEKWRMLKDSASYNTE